MAVIKQIAIHNGQSWGTPNDIGAEAENISYEKTHGKTEIANAKQAFDDIFDSIETLENAGDITQLNNKVQNIETALDLGTTTPGNAKIVSRITDAENSIQELRGNKLSITGGNLTGDVTFGSNANLILSQGRLDINDNNITIADNNITNTEASEDMLLNGLFLSDDGTNYNQYASIQGIQKQYDSYPSLMVNYQRTVEGNIKQNNLLMGIDSRGKSTIEVSDPDAWRHALLNNDNLADWKKDLQIQMCRNKVQPISLSGTKQVKSGSNVNLCTINYTPGFWITSIYIRFGSNATGRRAVFLSSTNTGNADNTYANFNVTQQAVNGAETCITASKGANWGIDLTRYLNCWQNSGSNLNVTYAVIAYKIFDSVVSDDN